MNHQYIEPEWPVPPNIHAMTTLRTGGFSQGAYASMNPALHVGDGDSLVLRNRTLLMERLGLPSEPFWLNQVHGASVIDANSAEHRQADASFTSEPGIVCVVMTADCLPVLLCNPENGKIAAVHAGWRGLLEGVIEATLEVMGSYPVAWLGPAIGPNAFEVGVDVRDLFLEKSTEFNSAFAARNDRKWMLDIYAVARIILSKGGVGYIGGGNWCTYSDPRRFFSYRRDGKCGRLATMIWRE